MSEYIGTPQRPDSITLADDSSPPQAGEINPGIEANRDFILWLEQKMGQSFSKFSARNFVPASFISALANGSTQAKCTAINANNDVFCAALRSANVSPDSQIIVTTRDGFGWQNIGVAGNLDVVDNREVGALAFRSDGYLILACSAGEGPSPVGQGQRIYVSGPDGVFDYVLRAGLSNNTSYRGACFVGDRAYAFGCTRSMFTTPIAGASTRVVTSTFAGGFKDWTTAPGGSSFTGGNADSRVWKPCVGSNGIVLATQGLASTDGRYIRVDANTNQVVEGNLPLSDGQWCNFVWWKNRFWAFQTPDVFTSLVKLYSSVDGLTWEFVTDIESPIAYNAFAEGECMGLLSGVIPGPGAYKQRTLYITFDGITWTAMPVSASTAFSHIVSTRDRTMALSTISMTPPTDVNMRVSLGGLQ